MAARLRVSIGNIARCRSRAHSAAPALPAHRRGKTTPGNSHPVDALQVFAAIQKRVG